MGGAQDASAQRPYELRLSRIDDVRLRDRLGRWLVQRVPGAEGESLSRALGGTGVVMRVDLSDSEASALLRELYATGVPPVAVVLRPVDPVRSRLTSEGGGEHAFAPFEARGGRFAPTWNWRAFVFGPLWYFRQGLYGKGLALLLLSVIPLRSLEATVLVTLAALLYCGAAGNWDRYLWRMKGTQWW